MSTDPYCSQIENPPEDYQFDNGLNEQAENMSLMWAWDVIVDDRVIDTVHFIGTMDADEVRRSLIDHDGYSNHIRVIPGAL